MLSRWLWNTYFAAKGLKEYWSDLDRFQVMRPDEARADLSRRLLRQIHYFGSREDALPEWKEAARIEDPSELWQVWPSLPILKKEDLRYRFHPTSIRKCAGAGGQVSSTGGSTGEPTPYLHDPAMLRATTASRIYSRLRMGWKPGMPAICVWGSERDIGRQRSLRNRISSAMRRDFLVDGYAMNNGTVDAVLAAMRPHRAVALFGFTSMLEFVAREMARRGDRPARGVVRALWNGGEMLFDQQRKLFHQVFGLPMLNAYGGRELSLLAFERLAGAPLSVMRPLVFIELVDKDGRPAAPGEPGRLICTSTVCRGTPFLRYEIGDVATSRVEDRDESGICAISQLQGRIAGLLELPGGRTVNCLFWNHLFKEYEEVLQFQVQIRGEAGITLLFKGFPFEADREDSLRSRLRAFLGDIPVRIEWLPTLPLTNHGKLLQVVRV